MKMKEVHAALQEMDEIRAMLGHTGFPQGDPLRSGVGDLIEKGQYRPHGSKITYEVEGVFTLENGVIILGRDPGINEYAVFQTSFRKREVPVDKFVGASKAKAASMFKDMIKDALKAWKK